jgi:hypothetical protein
MTFDWLDELVDDRRFAMDRLDEIACFLGDLDQYESDMVAISLAFNKDSQHPPVFRHDLKRILENSRSFYLAQLQEIENKIASKFKE